MTIRVLIVDDHAIVRAGLRALLNGEPGMDLVGEATNGEEAVLLTQTVQPDVVVLDLSMPGLDGIRATREIKQILPEVRILILTIHEDEALLREAIQAGASGYIIKNLSEKCQVEQDMSTGQLDKGHPVTGFLRPASTHTASPS